MCNYVRNVIIFRETSLNSVIKVWSGDCSNFAHLPHHSKQCRYISSIRDLYKGHRLKCAPLWSGLIHKNISLILLDWFLFIYFWLVCFVVTAEEWQWIGKCCHDAGSALTLPQKKFLFFLNDFYFVNKTRCFFVVFFVVMHYEGKILTETSLKYVCVYRA